MKWKNFLLLSAGCWPLAVYFGIRHTFSIRIPLIKHYRAFCSCLQIYSTLIWSVIRNSATFNIQCYSTKCSICEIKFQALRHLDLNFYMVMYATFSSLLNLYIYCYFGTFTTSNFEQLELYIYESGWYHLPNDLQQYFIMMIKNAQQPLTYDGFRFVSLNLITLAKVSLVTCFSSPNGK